MSDIADIISSRVPINVRAYIIPALENSVQWVNETKKKETYLNGHERVAKAPIGYLRNVAAQVALKGVMQFHIPKIKCQEACNKIRSYYYYEFAAPNFLLTISQVNQINQFPPKSLYRNMLIDRSEPILFGNEVSEEVVPYFLITFNVEKEKLVSAKMGIPVNYNGQMKWKGNSCIDLFKEPHLMPAQLPQEVVDKPMVEFMNTAMEVSEDE